MALKRRIVLPLAVFVLAGYGAATAQTSNGGWRSTSAIAISGSRAPVYSSETDQGAAPAGEHLQRMLLLLTPSPEQQLALNAELANLQNPASPEYHQWLTPAVFAAKYANSAADVAVVSSWLQSEGFTVAVLPTGRGWIEFSGTVAQVEEAFQTQIHTVATAAGPRPVIGRSISVPGALIPLVQGLVSLDGAVAAPAIITPYSVSATAAELAAQTMPGAAQPLTPRLVSDLLRLDALHSAGIAGAGETIAIPSRSNLNTADVDAFRTIFALPAMKLKVIPSGVDPGLGGDQAEATLAASWAGTAAPGAQIVLVPAATTDATDGLDLSLATIVDQALAHTVAVGYSACEAELSSAHQSFYAALYRQAAAEGIAVIAASGDSGSSACHPSGSDAPVSSGYGVNALASTPWNTSVGVAAFGLIGPAAGNTAMVAWSPVNAADPAYASGGGKSILFAEPDWQPIPAQLAAQIGAVTGGLGTRNRLMPDLVLPTAIDTAANQGLVFCLSGATSSGGCTLVRSGGSSAATALFAGIAALVAEKNGAQGNLAPTLYALSGKSGVFTDIQQGSAQLKCVAGSPGCGATGQIGFTAGVGFDLATGLGVPDATALVTLWASPLVTGTGAVTVSITTGPMTINPSAVITINAQVTSGTGGATPTGTILFFNATTAANLTSTPSTIAPTGTAALSIEGGFANGANQIEAIYSGDATYQAATSQPVVITAQPSATSLVIVPSNYSPSAGATITVMATLSVTNPGNSPPSGQVSLTLDGAPASTTNIGGTTATFSVIIPSTGTHNLQAVYAGDANYAGSTSQPVTINSNKSSTTLAVTSTTATPTSGGTVAVTATITAPAGSSLQPSGTISFTLDGANAGTANVVPGSPSIATIAIPLVSAGSHNLQAIYSGDNNYITSTSPSVLITVSKGASVSTLVGSPPALSPGVAETFTATIAPTIPVAGVTYSFAGTVTFYDGGSTLLGQVTVSNNQAVLSGVTLKNGVSHAITAVYSGDGNWVGSTSAAVSLSSTLLSDSVVLSANHSAVQFGTALILTATVIPTVAPTGSVEANPTGTVIFYDGTAAIGTALLTAVAGTDTSTATLTTQTQPAGQNTITAVYQGDGYYSSATSNPLTLTVEDFTITPAASNPPTNLNINKGGAGSALFVVTGAGGFNNLVQIVCAVPAQDYMTCTPSPQQVTPTATVTFVVQTFQTGSVASRTEPRPMFPRVAGGTALAVLGFFLLPLGRRTRKLLLKYGGHSARRWLVIFFLLAGLAGTGIGCNSDTAIVSSGTPLGVVTLKITGSAYVDNTVVSHSVYLTVDVLAPGATAP